MLNAGRTQKNYWRLFFLSLVDLVSGSPESFIVPYVFYYVTASLFLRELDALINVLLLYISYSAQISS